MVANHTLADVRKRQHKVHSHYDDNDPHSCVIYSILDQISSVEKAPWNKDSDSAHCPSEIHHISLFFQALGVQVGSWKLD